MATRKTTSPRKKSAGTATGTSKKAVAKRVRKPPQAARAIGTAAAAGPPPPSTAAWLQAVRAAESRKATDIQVLDLREVTTFCDFFVIASGSNPKQVQAIAEAIDMDLRKIGERANAVEGFDNAEWILADYGDFIVHVFSDKARQFYELERLWRAARPVEIPAEA